MPDDLMTLTMTREVFPYFKKLLESNKLNDGDYMVEFTVEESAPGVIRLMAAKWKRSTDAERP